MTAAVVPLPRPATTPAWLDEHHAIVGSSGAGKTVTAKSGVEQLLAERRHLVVIDPTDAWYGLRSDVAGTGPGFDLPIFGGRHGDVAIGADDGDAIARIIIEQRVSAIVSLAHLHDDVLQRRFLQPFVHRLRAKPRGNFHLVVDEADELCPQTPPDDVSFKLMRDMIWIAKRGRLAGFVLTLITQRPADIAKAALSQVQTIVAHQLVDPRDQKAIDDYLRAKGDKEVRAEVMGSLASLERGERWIYSPRAGLLERGHTSPITTFDSSRTPAPGELQLEPRMLAELDVSAIAAALARPDEADAIPDDPEAAYAKGGAVGEALATRDRRIVELELEREELRRDLSHTEEFAASLVKRIGAAKFALSDPGEDEDEDEDEDADVADQDGVSAKGSGGGSSVSPAPEGEASTGGDVSSIRGRKALQALVARPTLTERQWAWVAGFSLKGGTWGTYKSALRAAELVEEQDGRWAATAAGRALIGDDLGDWPRLGRDVARLWGKKLPGVGRMVETLLKRWPHLVSRDGLAGDLGMAASGGTFGTYLSRLRSNGLIEERGKRLRLRPELMGEQG